MVRWGENYRSSGKCGITSSPLLRPDGEIVAKTGYDAATGMWCERTPDLSASMPHFPSRAEAEAALRLLRTFLKTFCFVGSPTVIDPETATAHIDLAQPPSAAESAGIVGLLTAVCRSSIPLAPGFIITAPEISGAGSGKGLLARVITAVAFGSAPYAVTAGANIEEFDKRIAAELLAGGSNLFLDNLNGRTLNSELLASVIIERQTRTRILGKSQMQTLNSSAFVVITGNGLSVSEDLARRFIVIELDPGVEDAEGRVFEGDLLKEAFGRRDELLAAALTIWRWGRQNQVQQGKSLGSFGDWVSWVRDPLFALGCADPVVDMLKRKANDPNRQRLTMFFDTWFARYADSRLQQKDIAKDVLAELDPDELSRQAVAERLKRLDRTRQGGFAFRMQKTAKHTPAEYWIEKTVTG